MIEVNSHNTKTVKIRHVIGGQSSWIEIKLFGPDDPEFSDGQITIFGPHSDFPDLKVNWGDRPVVEFAKQAKISTELLWFANQIFAGLDTKMITIDTPADETLANILRRGRKAVAEAEEVLSNAGAANANF